MVHYGKHIIDPETGLCEICDRGPIHDYKQGKRPGRQFLYSNQDGKFTYRASDEDDMRYKHEEITPRVVRKAPHSEPPPRVRPVVHEEPVIVQKKTPRYNHSSMDDIQNHPPPPPFAAARPTTFYYVDNTGQMLPRSDIPHDDPPRRYMVQNHPPAAATRPTRVPQRRAQTPPPQRSEPWRSRPKRQINSDTEILQQPRRTKPNDSHYDQQPRRTQPNDSHYDQQPRRTNPNDSYYDQSSPRAEMFHIQRPHQDSHYSTLDSLVPRSHEKTVSPSKIVYQSDPNRKQRPLEPIDRRHYNESEPTVIKKVYKKLPASRYEVPESQHSPNGNHLQPVRKVEKIYPSPRSYQSSQPVTHRSIQSPVPTNQASVYYIQSVNGF